MSSPTDSTIINKHTNEPIPELKIEVLPRYGFKLGEIWFDGEVIGAIRLRHPKEVELWQKIISLAPQLLKDLELDWLQETKSL